MQFKLWLETTSPYIKKIKDPALFTFDEFYKLINSQFKSHGGDAYDWYVSDMKGKKSDYPQLLFNKTINNINFEFRLNKKDRFNEKFVKFDDNNQPLKINGKLQYYNLEELEKLRVRRWDFSYSIFHGEQQVAVSQDEWGCLLVVVAREYRGFGLGPIITKMAWESEPGKDSGGCTPMGKQLVRKVHGEFVREYLQKGFYSHLVSQGTLTNERAKQIISSAVLTKNTKQADYGTDNPENWLLFNGDGIFIIYDKKLRDLVNVDEDKDYWREKTIKGVADIGPHYTNKNYRLRVFGGESDSLKKFLMLLAVSWVSESNELLRISKEHLPFIDTDKIEINGEWAKIKSDPINYKPMVMAEKKFRKEFDKYGEFHDRLIELAVSKYDE